MYKYNTNRLIGRKNAMRCDTSRIGSCGASSQDRRRSRCAQMPPDAAAPSDPCQASLRRWAARCARRESPPNLRVVARNTEDASRQRPTLEVCYMDINNVTIIIKMLCIRIKKSRTTVSTIEDLTWWASRFLVIQVGSACRLERQLSPGIEGSSRRGGEPGWHPRLSESLY